jgi:hypothetical protein
MRLAMINYRRRWKDVIPPTLGTGWLSHNSRNTFFDDNFNKEFSAVKRELKRLGIDNP